MFKTKKNPEDWPPGFYFIFAWRLLISNSHQRNKLKTISMENDDDASSC